MKLIGLVSKMGSGKDYISINLLKPFLQAHGLNVVILGIADQVKCIGSCENDFSYHDLEMKQSNVRKWLQKFANSKRTHRQNYWINALDVRLKLDHKRNQFDVAIITDVRFLNEAQYIQSNNGIIVKVDSPCRHNDYVKQMNLDTATIEDISETELDMISPDLIYYNDFEQTQEQLESNTKVLEIIRNRFILT